MKTTIYKDIDAIKYAENILRRDEEILTKNAQLIIQANSERYVIPHKYVWKISQIDAKNYGKAIAALEEIVAEAFQDFTNSQISERAKDIAALFTHNKKHTRFHADVPPLRRWWPTDWFEIRPEYFQVHPESGEVIATDEIRQMIKERHTHTLTKQQQHLKDAAERLCDTLVEMGKDLPSYPKKLLFDRLIRYEENGAPYVEDSQIVKFFQGK